MSFLVGSVVTVTVGMGASTIKRDIFLEIVVSFHGFKLILLVICHHLAPALNLIRTPHHAVGIGFLAVPSFRSILDIGTIMDT